MIDLDFDKQDSPFASIRTNERRRKTEQLRPDRRPLTLDEAQSQGSIHAGSGGPERTGAAIPGTLRNL